MTSEKLRVLLVESSPGDAQKVLAKLAAGGYEVESHQVDTAEGMKFALAEHPLDLILCSYDPPGFGGLEALHLLQDARIDLPFLFLSHDLREKTIIDAMRSGADDFILKGSLNRLASAIEHNLREARIRREHRNAQLALQENQIRLHAFIANLPGLAYQILRTEDGKLHFPYVSEGALALLGISHEVLEQDSDVFHQMLHLDDRASYFEAMQLSFQQMSFWNWEGRILLPPDNEVKWINLRCTPRLLETSNVLWEGIMFNITQSKQAEIELNHSREQLRALSMHVQDVREEERLNIAREVHDNLGSLLTAIKLDIAWLGGRMSGEGHKLAEKARDIETTTDKCIAAARDISRTLRPSVLDNFGIAAAIEMEADEFCRRTGIPCKLERMDDVVDLSPDVSIALFRILQEALNNIIKHARRANEVRVQLINGVECIDLIVSDNGCGIAQRDRQKPRSFGLRGIQERVSHFGGDLRIDSAPGKGTTLSVCIPHNPKPHDLTTITLHQQALF
ncbi:ATP-binding protein [Ferriphaselus sp. R-1]|uniref:hybrid sensor histidine kinase/response regulator n=1 Tax=Ferriphaselus sp. R-1 TaxID=1485544 RepID=UPI00068DB70F|nr:ATP-binding protein [Ferriphaselus sp. R-1]